MESLSAAKQRLLDDVEALKEVKLPHIPRRQDGDGRITREVDDLIAIFNLLDERKSIELLSCRSRIVNSLTSLNSATLAFS